jgi:hypothetical protein
LLGRRFEEEGKEKRGVTARGHRGHIEIILFFFFSFPFFTMLQTLSALAALAVCAQTALGAEQRQHVRTSARHADQVEIRRTHEAWEAAAVEVAAQAGPDLHSAWEGALAHGEEDIFAHVRPLIEHQEAHRGSVQAMSLVETGAGAKAAAGVGKVHAFCEICILIMQMKERGQPHLCAGLNPDYFISVRAGHGGVDVGDVVVWTTRRGGRVGAWVRARGRGRETDRERERQRERGTTWGGARHYGDGAGRERLVAGARKGHGNGAPFRALFLETKYLRCVFLNPPPPRHAFVSFVLHCLAHSRFFFPHFYRLILHTQTKTKTTIHSVSKTSKVSCDPIRPWFTGCEAGACTWTAKGPRL